MKEQKLLPGSEHTLTAVRKSDAGVFLDAGTGNTSDDILLHKVQQTHEVQLGEKVLVGLYLDPKKRLTASMKLARIKEGKVGLGTVISVTKQGSFIDIGAERGVFLPFSQMRGRVNPGQVVLVKLYRDKSERQAVTMLVEDDIKKMAEPANTKKGTQISGRVYNALDDGWLLFTAEKYIAFLHRDEATQSKIAIGDEISGRITFVRPDGRVNISQRLQKEQALVSDAEMILAFLRERNGRMPYDDSTPPEIVRDKFMLSKAAFKRALGQLMKQGQIEQEDGWTILKEL